MKQLTNFLFATAVMAVISVDLAMHLQSQIRTAILRDQRRRHLLVARPVVRRSSTRRYAAFVCAAMIARIIPIIRSG
ncbi:MAG: hypothetical protein WA197_08045 [Candidatus Acidiferrales bacterium]